MHTARTAFRTLLLASALFGATIPSQASAYAWTAATSEEYPPVSAPAGNAVTGIACANGGCNDISLEYNPIGSSTVQWRGWNRFISEESPTSLICPGTSYVTAISCNGGWCDNVSLECTQFTNIGRNNSTCRWSPWLYEGTRLADVDYYVAGAECRGAYCAEMRFYECRR